MANKILIKRGTAAAIPVLDVGELGLATDTKKLYVGTSSGNVEIANVSEIPAVPSAGTGNPLMDGVASAGSAATWSKSDHRHPTDTSRAAASDLAAKQGKYVSATVTLTVAGWSGNTQTVAASGVASNNLVEVSPLPSSLEAYVNAGIYCSAQASGTLTFTCKTVPSAALEVNVVVWN